MRLINRRIVLVAAAALSLAACNKGGGQAVTDQDMTMGSPTAKVTMVEYASVACPHCAKFNNEIFPAFKAKYIDTGKVRYVAREALTGSPAVAAAGFLLARCAGKDKYFQVTDAIYRAQTDMFTSGDVRGTLLRIGQSAGLSEDQFNSCITDEKAIKALNDRVEKTNTQDKVDGTPDFFVNGKHVATGEVTLQQLSAAIDPLLKS
jgi:protein-disulfide isomerase